jgi:hypothetical protein
MVLVFNNFCNDIFFTYFSKPIGLLWPVKINFKPKGQMGHPMMKKICFLLLLLCLNWHILSAQPIDYPSKQELLHTQILKLSEINDSVFGLNKDMINGKLLYSGGNMYIHPFFLDNYWKDGTILFQGKSYEMEMVKYDIYKDYLVHLHSVNFYSYPVYLNRELVKEFIINGYNFRYIDDFEKSGKSEYKPGYYQVLYDGKTKFYIQREKLKKFNIVYIDEGYVERIYFVLKKDGKYIRIVNQKSLIEALSDHKEEIITYMKKNKLRFSIKNYEFTGKVLEYYDNL